MNRQDISKLVEDAIKAKYVGTLYNGKKVIDAEVCITEFSYDNENWGGSVDEIKIRLKVTSPKGKSSKWINYYF